MLSSNHWLLVLKVEHHCWMWLTAQGARMMLVATLIGSRCLRWLHWTPSVCCTMCLIRADMLAAAGSQSSPVCVEISIVVCWLVGLICANLSTEGSVFYQHNWCWKGCTQMAAQIICSHCSSTLSQQTFLCRWPNSPTWLIFNHLCQSIYQNCINWI